MTDLETKVTFFLTRIHLFTFIFLFYYFILKADQKGRRVLKERKLEAMRKKEQK